MNESVARRGSIVLTFYMVAILNVLEDLNSVERVEIWVQIKINKRRLVLRNSILAYSAVRTVCTASWKKFCLNFR